MATTANDSNKSTSQTASKTAARKPAANRSANKSANGSSSKSQNARRKPASRSGGKNWSVPEVPTWVGIAASVVGAGLAAGFFAWRHQQNGGTWGDNFNAAFADGETDSENFDQTRNAGPNSMRDDHDDWEDIDELSDASFQASDPPSFNPGTA